MPRRRFMVANWKMYKTPLETVAYIERLGAQLEPRFQAAAVLAPAFPCLPAAAQAAARFDFALAAQNLHWAPEGAYTGEVSAAMLTAAGCRYVIVGHSERRQLFGETDEIVRRKAEAAAAARLIPIVCVGETLAERQRGETDAVLRRQCEAALSGLAAAAGPGGFLLAYEPIWAIGTGNPATPETAQAAHHELRLCLTRLGGEALAARTPILYGGSVKLDNIAVLAACPDVDGGLVGGASLDPAVFAQLVQRVV